MSKNIDCFDEDRAIMVYKIEFILQLFRHIYFKPNDFHLWSNIKGTMFYR